jgi:hypothetical protein
MVVLSSMLRLCSVTGLRTGNDMRIMGPSSESLDTVRELVLLTKNPDPRFVNDMLPALWEEALRYGIDPVGMVAQSGLETNWGKFGRLVTPEFYNTAGIKINPALQKMFPEVDGEVRFAHQTFGSWTMGARAQAQHLRKYAGAPVPDEDVVAARYHAVTLKRCVNFSELGGKWAPRADYGLDIERVARTLVEVGL